MFGTSDHAESVLERRDVVEPGDRHNLVATEKDLGPVAPDTEPDGIVDINFPRGRTVPEVMEIGIAQFQEQGIAPNECTQTYIRRDEVDDHNLSQKRFKQW